VEWKAVGVVEKRLWKGVQLFFPCPAPGPVFAVSAVFVVCTVIVVSAVCGLYVTHCPVLVPGCRCTPVRSEAPAVRTCGECEGRSQN
jgi:hypothetical protein